MNMLFRPRLETAGNNQVSHVSAMKAYYTQQWRVGLKIVSRTTACAPKPDAVPQVAQRGGVVSHPALHVRHTNVHPHSTRSVLTFRRKNILKNDRSPGGPQTPSNCGKRHRLDCVQV